MRHLPLGLLAALACTPPPPPPPPPRDPPQVFLLAPEANVVGTSIKLTLNVNGCDKVASASVLDRESFIKNVDFQGNPTTVEIASNELSSQYATLGIAADLSLVAKATCDDGRTNKSQPTPAKFFPVEQVVESAAGNQMAPDVFYAEGGIGGTGTTFVGCVGTQSGTALARVDTTGTVIGANTSLPFPCSYLSQFTDKNAATGKRWMWERGKGAFAFDQNLNITSYYVGALYALGVGPDGDAIVYESKAPVSSVMRISHAAAPPGNLRWAGGYKPSGLLMGNPVVQTQLNAVALPVWYDEIGAYNGTVRIERVDYSNGAFVGRNDLKVIEYGFLNAPRIPPAVFNSDASILYFPFQTGQAVNTATSAVIACATNADGCAGASQRWQSPILTGLVAANIPFSNGSQVAAIAAQHLWFLNATNGQVTNFAGKAIIPDGSLVTLGAQAGLGTDFYVLNGPVGGYPVEIVAVDSPSDGELYRYQMSGGVSPTNALTMAVDDWGAAWLRIGLKLVKPLPLKQYRLVRGANSG
ncbi:MAG: hypothetical protein HYZ28_08565 [Myxococcales bacterium]|nr:hypothetical protein [Myxococcales bacterium]